MAKPATDIRETVRERYAAAATAAGEGSGSCGCSPCSVDVTDEDGNQVFGSALYDDAAEVPDSAVAASLGCGVPTAVADLHEGETVLDPGVGAPERTCSSPRGAWAPPAGPSVWYMTDEMLDLARANAAEAGVTNAEFVKGYIEDLPLPDASVDVVISNCVINLSGDKRKVLPRVARVLAEGGRFAVSDVIADPDMDEATRADMRAWTGCIAGTPSRARSSKTP